MNLSIAQLRDLAASVGFPDPSLMAAIAMAESGGNTTAVNDTRGLTDDQIRARFGLSPGTPVAQEWSVGLWQINALTGDVDPARLTDPTYNAQVAFARSAGGTNLNPWWLTVSRGTYRQYLPSGYGAPPPVAQPTLTPPVPSRNRSGLLVALGAVALAGTAGYVAFAGRRSRRDQWPPDFDPDPDRTVRPYGP